MNERTLEDPGELNLPAVLASGDLPAFSRLFRYWWVWRVMSWLPARPALVWDLGCGGGHGARILAEKTECAINAVDRDDRALRAALLWYGDQPRIRFDQCDLEQETWPFETARPDLIVALDLLDQLSHREIFLHHLSRVVGRGVVLLSAPVFPVLVTRADPRGPVRIGYTKPELLDLLHRYFAVVRFGREADPTGFVQETQAWLAQRAGEALELGDDLVWCEDQRE